MIETAVDRRRQADALGMPVTLIRLTADPELIETRLRARHRHDVNGADLAWHLRRIRELAAILEASGTDDAVIDVTRLTPNEAATAVLDAAGWDERG